MIDFKSLRYDVDETDGQAIVTVERLGGVGGAVSVDYQTSDGSATAGSDYAATSGTLNWAAGDSADKTFMVPVTWDGRAEGTESISLELTNPGGGADLGPNTAAVLRVGDDGASGPLALSSNAYTVGEADGLVTVTVTRSGGSLGGPVTVDYATSDGTATAGSDYTATSGTLTFGPGEATKSFTVHVTSDPAHEGSEAFQVTLSNAGGGASLGSPAGAAVTITDDDDPAGLIDFKSLRYDVDENEDGQATVTVQRLGGVGGAVSVDYRTSDASATAGADYAAKSGTLNWAAGDGADKSFTVPVTWDGRAEGTESISLTLTNPGGGADQGPNSAAVLRIGDDGASGPLALSSKPTRWARPTAWSRSPHSARAAASAAQSRSTTPPATARRPRAPTTRPPAARSPSALARPPRASPSGSRTIPRTKATRRSK